MSVSFPSFGGSPRPTKRRPAGLHHDISLLRRLMFGRPIETEHQEKELLPKFLALPVFSSDAISSVAYASQQILLVLGAAGLWTAAHQGLYTALTMGITFAIVGLLVIVTSSYWQTIFGYPSGGGSYIVSKDNLGVIPGLIAGSALLIDYVLTVAVSIASGVQNLLATPFVAQYHLDLTAVCVLCVAIITFLNLRGMKESGAVFAVPTYSFIVMACLMIFLGTAGPLFGWHIYAETVNQSVPAASQTATLTSFGMLAVLAVGLRAFANGCSAMTGTEAVSNGIPAFRKPASLNAALTLVMMSCILGSLFLGISHLAMSLHVVYWEHNHMTSAPVIDQLSGAIFGRNATGIRMVLYYTMQISTMLILVVAANTSFADFPRLASIMARDRFLPRQLSTVGDKLVFSNGIALLGLLAMLLLIKFHGSVDRLIPLYAVGVFTAFTLSQSGMVRHWHKLKTRGWHWRAIVNGIGAVFTGIVMSTIIYEKFLEGAYIVVFLVAILVVTFLTINSHYEFLRRKLTIINWTPTKHAFSNTVLVLVPSLHRGMFPTLEYAQSIAPDCRAIHIEIDPNESARLKREWEQYVGEDLPLVIVPSLYRSLIAPVLVYLDEVRHERPDNIVTVVLTEFVPEGRWHAFLHKFLHSRSGPMLRYYLMRRHGVIVTNVRYYVDGDGSITTWHTDPGTTGALP